jgi:hypothetical protein
METLRKIQLYLGICVVLAAAYSAWMFLSRRAADEEWKKRQKPAPATWNKEMERLYGGTDVRILQFYARDGVIAPGAHTVICYGVVNAKSVHIDPPVDGVSVSLNRCVEIAPRHNTQYTLTAEGNDGHVVSAGFVVSVKRE